MHDFQEQCGRHLKAKWIHGSSIRFFNRARNWKIAETKRLGKQKKAAKNCERNCSTNTLRKVSEAGRQEGHKCWNCLPLFCLPVKQCIIKQLLDWVFAISGIIKVTVISRSRRLITVTSTLIIPDIAKTSSNNCLLFLWYKKESYPQRTIIITLTIPLLRSQSGSALNPSYRHHKGIMVSYARLLATKNLFSLSTRESFVS